MNSVQTPRKPARDEPLLELKVPEDSRGQVAATVPVRWCVGKRLFDAVREKGFKNPYVILVVRNHTDIEEYGVKRREWHNTGIYAVPLTQELTFVSFRRPGRNDIKAFVVDMNDVWAKWVRNARRELPNSWEIFNEKGDLGSVIPKNEWPLIETTARKRVIVPAEMFAPEPPRWLENMVTSLFTGKGADQCGFKKRVLVVVFLGWLLALGAYAVKAYAALLYLFFGRLPNKGFWRLAVKPLQLRGWTDALSASRESLWWHGPKPSVLPIGPLVIVNPPVLLLLPTVVWGIEKIPWGQKAVNNKIVNYAYGHMSWTQLVVWVDGVLVGAVVAILMVVGLIFLVPMLFRLFSENYPRLAATPVARPLVAVAKRLDNFLHNRTAATQAKKAERLRLEELELEAALAAMTCRSEASEVSVAALPAEKQTVRLRFNDFKTRVCKPFAA